MSGPVHVDAAGKPVGVDDPTRLVWYGSCGYWTDDWSRLPLVRQHIPVCPECKAPGFQITFLEWARGAKKHADANPGYLERLGGMRERCPVVNQDEKP